MDLLVAQRMSESNALLRAQMFNKTEDTEDQEEYYEQDYSGPEEELTSLIERSEECRKEVGENKHICLQYENIEQQALDEMYVLSTILKA